MKKSKKNLSKREKTKLNKFNLKKEYIDSWKYIKESKKFIFIIAIIFLAATLIGFFVPTPESISVQILSFLKELLNKTQGMSQFQLIKFIFLNNVQSSFLGLVFGFFLGIFSILLSLINGFLLGFVFSLAYTNAGPFVLWKILPHGIFELPAILISLGLGLKFGTFIFKKDSEESFKEYLYKSLKVFLLIVIPLLIIAAIIEGTLIYIQ